MRESKFSTIPISTLDYVLENVVEKNRVHNSKLNGKLNGWRCFKIKKIA